MESSVQKPLPAIPQVPGTSPYAVLSDESKTHLSKFIRHILAQDEKLFASQASQETWARLIEAALDDLGQSVLKGDWMAGLKFNKQWIRSRKDKSRKAQEVGVDSRSLTDKKRDDSVEDKTSQSNNVISSPSSGHETAAATSVVTIANHATALDQLRLCLSRQEPNRHANPVNHLVLCVTSFETTSPSTKHNKEPHSTPGCVFKVQDFTLPDDEKKGGLLLFGLDEWDSDAFVSGERAINIVGGTFFFQGIDSLALYGALFRLLRLSVYFHHSLVLEQHFLGNSNVEMNFTAQPTPQITQPSPPAVPPVEPSSSKPRNRQSHVTSGILSLVSKTGSLISRTTSLRTIKTRSFDQPPSAYRGSDRPTSQAAQRLRRFSFTSSTRLSPVKQGQEKDDAEPPFSSALKHIEQTGEFLSTSIGVSFKPPFLLVRLAEKAKSESPFHIKGDEKAGLHTILGWDKKNARWNGLSGTPGFVRHQTFSVLYLQVPVVQAPLPTPASETPSSSSLALKQPAAIMSKCSMPHLKTFIHYSHTADKPLGEAIIELCSHANQRCKTPECQAEMSQHEQRYIHDGVMITVRLSPYEGGKSEDKDDLGLWLSCRVCQSRTKRSDMSNGTYLFSFSKYLEILVYSPAVHVITPSLCEHTAVPSPPATAPSPPSAPSRFNIIRHFSYTTWVVSFSLSAFEDSFELRVPRLQIIRDRNSSGQISSSTNEIQSPGSTRNPNEEKKALRKEILLWWQAVSERIDRLESSFTSDSSVISKALPRLPSIYDDSDDQDIAAPVPLPNLAPSRPLVSNAFGGDPQSAPKPTISVGAVSTKVDKATQTETDPAWLLLHLRLTFQGTERALYAQLARTQVCSLNDVRWSFRSTARVAIKRLSAWENKHLPKKGKSQANNEQIVSTEPDWWGNGSHAVPGGNIIVREGDWGSIIAYTLSSVDFQNELAKISAASPKSSSKDIPPPSSSPTTPSNVSSTMTSSQSYKFFGLGLEQYPDPTQDELWRETEPFSATITLKNHSRDPSSILSLRDVLRHRSLTNGSSGHSSSLLSNLVVETPPEILSPNESKQATKISKEGSGGEVTTDSETDVASRILNDFEGVSSESPPESSIPKDPDTHPTRKESSSLVSAESVGTARPGDSTPRPSTPPTKEDQPSSEKDAPMKQQTSSTVSSAPPSSFTTSITHGLNNAMRFVLKTGDSRRRVDSQTHQHQHGSLQVDTGIEEYPHINYEWTIGKRLRFSCTVYYAKQFDNLRRQCGLDDSFVKSLSQSSNWAAEGGKSKSNFWKTEDGRFIIKTLVDAWNVADLQVLVDLAPSYFNYVNSTANKSTVLAKLLGFYTVEIKNMETGAIQAKADLLVMENLFHEQNIVKTFDLKGIPGRKAKASLDVRSGQKSKTMFDSEWIEAQQRVTMLVRPHSKAILQEALESDCEFLARSNIMDYSLLLGVDEENKQIACGLVDTIGSFTFAKTLEYKAKHGLLRVGKDVTVVPPTEYRERFVSALNRYFLACPDKWSRPLDGQQVDCDPMHLPSVL